MKYAYEDMSPTQFEQLIVLLCQQLIGMSVQGFAVGVDGGRDAKFVGTAEMIPSKSAPWEGTIIIQAKHTNGHNRSFSESDFYSNSSDTNVIGEEIPRIIKLRENAELDHYMLFANRRLTANTESALRAHLAQKCSIPIGSINICGIEQLEMWLKNFSQVAELADLDPIDSPLIVSPNELAEVVEALALHKKEVSAVSSCPPTPRTSYAMKNQLNNMTDEYSKFLRNKYLKETAQIRTFLAAPENEKLMDYYEAIVDEFQLSIIAKKKDYQTFDEIFDYLFRMLFSRDAVLRKYKLLTRAVLFYMYWNCDIGMNEDAATDETFTS